MTQNYNEEFLKSHPHLFSELGVLTAKEIQENLDWMKNAMGYSLKLDQNIMKYNYAGMELINLLNKTNHLILQQLLTCIKDYRHSFSYITTK